MIDIIKLEKPVTIVTDSAITKAGSSFVVTARAEHIPRTSTVIGFPLNRGSVNNFVFIAFYLTEVFTVAKVESAGAADKLSV